MKVLVTGGYGQVGQNLKKYSGLFNVDVAVFGSRELDITDEGAVTSAVKAVNPGAIINAAAYTAVDQAEYEPHKAFLVNELGPKLLAQVCSDANIPLFHLSTDYVFSGNKLGLYNELDDVNPQTIYGASKEAGERAVRENLDRHIILRTSWVFSSEGKNFVKTMLRLIEDKEVLHVVDDQFGGPTSAASIAKILLSLVVKHDLCWGTYHFCQLPYVSWYEFAQIIFEEAKSFGILNKDVTVIPISSDAFSAPAKRPSNSKLECSKIELLSVSRDRYWLNDLRMLINSSQIDFSSDLSP